MTASQAGVIDLTRPEGPGVSEKGWVATSGTKALWQL
jgi:hypothetical protein